MVDFLIRRIEFLYAKMYLSGKSSKFSIKLGEAVNETLQRMCAGLQTAVA